MGPRPTEAATLVSEEALTRVVVDMAHLFGWAVAQVRPGRVIDKTGGKGQDTWRTPWGADGKGFPDLTLVRPPLILYAELKSARGRLSAEQKWWEHLLRRCAPYVAYYIWTPADVPEIEAILRDGPGMLNAYAV